MSDLLRETLPGSWRVLATTFPTSRWQVDQRSDNRDLIVLSFAKSLVTPVGVDVIGRGDRAHGRDLPQSYDGLHWLE